MITLLHILSSFYQIRMIQAFVAVAASCFWVTVFGQTGVTDCAVSENDISSNVDSVLLLYVLYILLTLSSCFYLMFSDLYTHLLTAF